MVFLWNFTVVTEKTGEDTIISDFPCYFLEWKERMEKGAEREGDAWR